MALSADRKLIEPLQTTLGIEDLHDILEVGLVDAHNAHMMAKAAAAAARERDQ